MSRAGRERREALEAEVRERMGFVPAFFRVGASTEIVESLWTHGRSAYLGSSIPPRFREELFTYLSRFCPVPYCMVQHAVFLQGTDARAGEPAPPQRKPDEVLRLLRLPAPRAVEIEGCLATLGDRARPIEAWPEEIGSPLGRALFACSVHIFLKGALRQRCLGELRRVLGLEKLERLTAFLSFIGTAHAWAEIHAGPELDTATEEMLREHPEYRPWVDRYRSVVEDELGVQDRSDALPLENEHQALQAATGHLGAILEGADFEIYVIDAETLRFMQVSQGARQNLGYSIAELRQLTPVDLEPELTAEAFAERLRPLRTGERPRIEFNTTHRRKDGSCYPVEIHLQPSTGVGSVAFVALILDLTERIAQREAVAESEARAQTILRTAADAIIMISEDGIIEEANAATVRLFGYARSELIGHNVEILMPPVHARAHDGYLKRYRATGERRIIGRGRELEARRKDGTLFPIRLSVGEARFDDTRLFTGIIHDLSAQKLAEAGRDEAHRRLRALFNQRTTLAGICSLDGALLAANKASLDYIGVDADEVVGRPFWETPWWSHDPALQQRLRSAIEAAARGDRVRFDATHPRADGSVGIVDFSITPISDATGRIDILLVESIDVTETRSLQEQLVQSQKMEAIGALASGIAHDFNNLLTSIRGSSEILVDHLEPGGRLARSADRIVRAADRATALTTRLLGFGRRQAPLRKPIDLQAAVEETRELFERTLASDIELKTRFHSERLYVDADEGQVVQVLTNLIINAGDAMPRGGSLLLETTRSVVSELRAEALDIAPGRYALLEVRDTGEGMQPETLARIFDPFFTTKAAGKGTGLGLSTSLQVVREHGGAIEAKSEPGIGTTFAVWLPEIEAPAAESDARPTAPATTRASGETILLVEDDDIMRELLAEVLEEEGYAVVSAGTPAEALRRASEQVGVIDLLVTDVVMPSMSGFLLARELGSRHRVARVLYMSGYTDHALVDRGELSEDDPFIRKPFGNDSLLAKVRTVLDRDPFTFS